VDTLRYKITSFFLKRFAHFKVFKYPFFVVYDPGSYLIKGSDYYIVKDLIKPGDILLRGYDNYLDGYFIPGTYSHAAMCIDKEKIIHSMTPNVQYIDLCTFMRCDKIAIIRPLLDVYKRATAVKRAVKQLGSPYDYDFIFEEGGNNKRYFSCSELIYHAYYPYREELDWNLKQKDYFFFNKKIFAPDDCLPTTKSKSTIIWSK